MEAIYNFLEQYWGYTLFGGVTFGTIITFIVFNLKSYFKGKENNKAIQAALEQISIVIEQRDAETVAKVKAQSQNMYYQKVQAFLFKAITYLAVSSKLPIEEKIALQEGFAQLRDEAIEAFKPLAEEVGQDVIDVLEENKDEGMAIIEEAAEAAQTLLEKYSQGG